MFESALRSGKKIRLTFTWRKIIHAYNLHTSFLRHSGLNASADPGLSLNGQFECVCVLKDVESFSEVTNYCQGTAERHDMN